MRDGVAILKEYGESHYDDYGNEKTEITETEVFVQSRGVYNSEFYNAAQAGLKPSLTIHLSTKEDYNGQKVLEHEGREYSVLRTDPDADGEGISLICEERVENG